MQPERRPCDRRCWFALTLSYAYRNICTGFALCHREPPIQRSPARLRAARGCLVAASRPSGWPARARPPPVLPDKTSVFSIEYDDSDALTGSRRPSRRDPGGCLEGARKDPGRTLGGAPEIPRAGLEDTWNLPEASVESLRNEIVTTCPRPGEHCWGAFQKSDGERLQPAAADSAARAVAGSWPRVCLRHRAAYSPALASRESWSPRSTMRPRRMTRI